MLHCSSWGNCFYSQTEKTHTIPPLLVSSPASGISLWEHESIKGNCITKRPAPSIGDDSGVPCKTSTL